jgi:hypothetical protein
MRARPIGLLGTARDVGVAHPVLSPRTRQALIMNDSLRNRVRAKLVRQLDEDGVPDAEQDDTRQVSIESDLDALDSVADDDPLVEELAARYLVF